MNVYYFFAMFFNDNVHGAEGVDITLLKSFLLLYADDITIFLKQLRVFKKK